MNVHAKLPVKLAKVPMIDAVFELRFSSSMPVAAFLPGALFSALSADGAKLSIVNLPQSQLPAMMREMDPNLAYAPLVRLEWEKFAVHIGDRSVGVLCKMPYPGWDAFSKVILDIIQKTVALGVVQAVERFALKYINLFQETDVEKAIAGFNMSLRLGQHQLKAESAQIRIEMRRDAYVHAVNIITQATAEDPLRKLRKTGAVLEVDSVSSTRWVNMGAFLEQMPAALDDIHLANKQIFIESLTENLVKEMGPVYD